MREMCVANAALSNAGGGELTRVRTYDGMLAYEWRWDLEQGVF
jgi:hypothetical protein